MEREKKKKKPTDDDDDDREELVACLPAFSINSSFSWLFITDLEQGAYRPLISIVTLWRSKSIVN